VADGKGARVGNGVSVQVGRGVAVKVAVLVETGDAVADGIADGVAVGGPKDTWIVTGEQAPKASNTIAKKSVRFISITSSSLSPRGLAAPFNQKHLTTETHARPSSGANYDSSFCLLQQL